MKPLACAVWRLRRRPARRLASALVAVLAALTLSGPVLAKMGVYDSPHNLSSTGGRNRASGRPGVVFADQGQVCIFCHVPHNAMAGTPLWSRALPDANSYQPYNQSSTLNASPKPDKPTGASRLCLSCHDGTIALSSYGRYRQIAPPDLRKMPLDYDPSLTAAQNATINANLSTDLQDDHPISFLYTEALAQKSQLVSPSALPGQIRLEGGTTLECTGCHDPHDQQYGNFLVMNNGSDDPTSPFFMTGSPLCTACHVPNGWNNSTHNNQTVRSLGHQCLACHSVHNAPGPIRLLNNATGEGNCLATCHNVNDSSSSNIASLVTSTMHRHPVDLHNSGLGMDHDEKENLPAVNYHVQCVDCHNPHQSNSQNAPLSNPPQIDGRLKGVRKDALGSYATTEYDVCYKCHAGVNAAKFAGVTELPPNRMLADPDQMERFDVQNPSFHPVAADRRGSGASLLTDLKPTMVRVYCTDCHNSDQSSKALGGGTGPNGPHGSQYPHILIARYDMPFLNAPRDPFSNSLYSLCYRCHSADYVMNNGGGSAFTSQEAGNEHLQHVSIRQIPCFVCHDPHGIPRQRGATATANAHLINFDRGYAVGTLVATPFYETTSPGSGSCTVNCHTVTGNTHSYGTGVGRRLLNQKRALPIRLR